jgi:hypothetical protein
MTRAWPKGDVALLGEIYVLRLSARMNVVYYKEETVRIQTWSACLSLATALMAGGTGIGTFFNNSVSSLLFLDALKITATLAAVAAIIRPIYAPMKRIERATRQVRGYQTNFNALRSLLISIETHGSMTQEHKKKFSTILERHNQLEIGDDCCVNYKRLVKAEKIAMSEFPKVMEWWPEVDHPPAAARILRLAA